MVHYIAIIHVQSHFNDSAFCFISDLRDGLNTKDTLDKIEISRFGNDWPLVSEKKGHRALQMYNMANFFASWLKWQFLIFFHNTFGLIKFGISLEWNFQGLRILRWMVLFRRLRLLQRLSEPLSNFLFSSSIILEHKKLRFQCFLTWKIDVESQLCILTETFPASLVASEV